MGGPQAPPGNAAVARGRRVPRRRGADHAAATGGDDDTPVSSTLQVAAGETGRGCLGR